VQYFWGRIELNNSSVGVKHWCQEKVPRSKTAKEVRINTGFESKTVFIMESRTDLDIMILVFTKLIP